MSLYPVPSRDTYVSFIGKDIRDVPAPAAVIDLATVKKNCAQMLEACDALDLEWRAHVKTHKTVELTRLQVGEGPRPVKLIISTLAELDLLLPLLQEYRSANRPINVAYGLPLGASQVPRLAALGKALGPDSLSILVDHPGQLALTPRFAELAGHPLHVHIKIDMGGRRAGVILESEQFNAVITDAIALHSAGHIVLAGLYSHAGHSYGGDSQAAAMSMLRDELVALMTGASAITAKASSIPPLTLSVGATPTALSVKNLLDGSTASNTKAQAAATAVRDIFAAAKAQGAVVEIHAGVYPLLDLQQLAAHSLSTSQMSWSDIAFTVVAEVCSVYPGRGAGGYDEVLIGAGGLALGRETCKAYPGLATLTPWNRKGVVMPEVDVEDHRGWIVGRFAQEHGICTWSGGDTVDSLEVGQKVRLWSNHACITSSHFGWYFVVDSSREGKEDEVVDIWVKARGW